MMNGMLKSSVTCVVLCAATVSCGSAVTATHVASDPAGLPLGNWDGVAWLSPTRLILEKIDVNTSRESLWTVREPVAKDGSARAEQLSAKLPKGCDDPAFSAFAPYSDASITVAVNCGRLGIPVSVVRIDPTGTTTPVIPSMTDGIGFPIAVASLSWNPQGSQAIGSYTSGICGTMFLADASGTHALTVVIGRGETAWNTATDFNHKETAGDCGLAFGATWSPKGDEVAFVSDPNGSYQSGQSRLDASLDIYRVGSDFHGPEVWIGGVRHVGSMQWSPNGEWLAFSGQVSGTDGVWLLRRGSSSARQVMSSADARIAWRPDGRALAVTYSIPPGADDSRTVRILDVSSVVR